MAVSNIKLFFYIVKNNFKTSFSSKSDAFMNIILMMINNLAFVFMWWVLFQNKTSINGWELKHVLLMQAFANLGFGIYAVLFRGAENIPQHIENGSLDSYITSPRNPLFMVTTSESTVANWGDVLTGLLLFAISGFWSIPNIFIFISLSILCFITIFSFRIIVSCLSFFKGNMDRLGNNLFMSLLIFASLPASIFTGWYKVLFLTIIPAGFIALIPVNIMSSLTWFDVASLLAFNIAIFSFAIWFWSFCLKRYSSGNKFGVR